MKEEESSLFYTLKKIKISQKIACEGEIILVFFVHSA